MLGVHVKVLDFLLAIENPPALDAEELTVRFLLDCLERNTADLIGRAHVRAAAPAAHAADAHRPPTIFRGGDLDGLRLGDQSV